MKLYSAEWCGACRTVRNALDARGIEYTYIDVDEHAEEVAMLGIRSIPVIVRDDGKRMTGISGGMGKLIEFVEGGSK